MLDTHPASEEAQNFQPVPVPGARKYKTVTEAKRAGATWWRSEGWPECLYKKLTVDRFFYRARSGNSRPFLQLETGDYEIAKRRLGDKLKEVADLRDSGQSDESGEFMTLGALTGELDRILARSERKEKTKKAYKNHVERLRACWQEGSFDTFHAVRVDLDLIMNLRKHLKDEAVFSAGRVTASVKKPKKRKGYSNNIINQTLWILRVLMDLAVQKRVRVTNPFLTKSTLEKKINLPKGQRNPVFPSTEVMQKLFAEMRRVPARTTSRPDGSKAIGETERMRERREWFANRAADLAQFMACTGCRHEEALDVRAGYDGRNVLGFLYVDGTKSKQSKRDVPIMAPGLRPLLDRLKAGKKPDERLFPEDFDCLQAMARACKRMGIQKLVQHEMRHYFATVMIESDARDRLRLVFRDRPGQTGCWRGGEPRRSSRRNG